MSGYRDSSFQYHHLVDSHQALYNEWNQDEFPPPDEQEIGSHHINNNNKSSANTNGVNHNEETVETSTKSYNATKGTINTYWDYFHDEEDWNLFRNVQLESNGVATFSQSYDRVTRNERNGVDNLHGGSTNSSNADSAAAITGSIFNNRITRMALIQKGNWNDLALPHPQQ